MAEVFNPVLGVCRYAFGALMLYLKYYLVIVFEDVVDELDEVFSNIEIGVMGGNTLMIVLAS